MRRLLVLFFIFIFFAACQKNKAPAGIIPEDKMVEVLTDMHLADGFATSLSDTAKIIAVYHTVYKTYGIDSLVFRKSVEYYSKDPRELKQIYEKVVDRLKVLEADEQAKELSRQKKEEARQKKTADSLKKISKFKRDSVTKDSVKKVNAKKASLKADSLKRDSIGKAFKERIRLKREKRRNDLSDKRPG